ncbi:superfamily II DNA helicase RecQ [Flavobacterium arsenatis]|uniref:Superfamily II DNA helicase RecQ n=1 Tax=Flavobacterium arsenatis TaxID=1484332 RepID=A0ABU1TLL5_9FLAO|nr:HRDC domain-containing protein [Flavobacterium arsenatis]MDR6966830.1 superfamily II DNA helicase RecQ [Flavobacterium arsenatis]
MKVNVFTIRLISEKFVSDQKFLNDFLETVDFVKSDVHFVEGDVSYWSVLIHFEEKKNEVKSEKKKDQILEEDLEPNQIALYNQLKNWRFQKSQDLNIPSFMISHNSELLSVVVKRPKMLSDLRKIKGFGELKVENHGEEILRIVNANQD